MPAATGTVTPGLSSFLASLKTTDVESSIEHFIALLKRRQIHNSRPCALATTKLLYHVVARFRDRDVDRLLRRVREVGQRLTAAQPREMVVGNIVRRVLGLIREVAEDDGLGSDKGSDAVTPDVGMSPHIHAQYDSLHRPQLTSSISTFSPLRHGATQPAELTHQLDGSSAPSLASSIHQDALSSRPPLLTSHTSYAATAQGPMVTSLFGLFSHPDGTPSPTATPPVPRSPAHRPINLPTTIAMKKENIKADVLEGIRELEDELSQADERIAESALSHIHTSEIILTSGSSQTVQTFLQTAARKRKFTVIHAESYPNDHVSTHNIVLHGKKSSEETGDDEDQDTRFKALTAMGITVILIPDSAIFAIMSRVNKVILPTHTVLANGSLLTSSGLLSICSAAKAHSVPIIILSAIYKLSPVYPFDIEELIEHGDAGAVVPFKEGEWVENIEVMNPLFDYVPAELVDLYVTNLGGMAPSYLYRIVADHYRVEDISL